MKKNPIEVAEVQNATQRGNQTASGFQEIFLCYDEKACDVLCERWLE